jgi:23S rRNA-/tRNA-specific pseudouridylate synthase
MILAETSEWVVVNKPSGWLTVPGRGLPGVPVLSEWIRERYPQAMVVHRLDRETTGVLLFALGEKAHQKAGDWFSKRETKKIYHLLAQGSPSAPILKVTDPIEGAPSTTQIEVKEKYEEGFFAWARPLTGRRHQIRIHLRSKGHPLWGDLSYGGPREIKFKSFDLKVERVALHAASLELPSGEKFEASYPEDFSQWLSTLREKGGKSVG